jgi:hypothetical protein
MGDKLSGKPRDASIRRGNFSFGNPSKMELFATAITLILPKKLQRSLVYARLENPYLLGHGLGRPGAPY